MIIGSPVERCVGENLYDFTIIFWQSSDKNAHANHIRMLFLQVATAGKVWRPSLLLSRHKYPTIHHEHQAVGNNTPWIFKKAANDYEQLQASILKSCTARFLSFVSSMRGRFLGSNFIFYSTVRSTQVTSETGCSPQPVLLTLQRELWVDLCAQTGRKTGTAGEPKLLLL